MPLIGDPPNNLAAVSLIRAAIADDPDSGVLIMSEHGGCLPGPEGKKAAQFMMSLAAVAARALLSAHGYNVERCLKTLDAWAAEYADDAAVW
jgi:rhamnose utilization protein RhaD (predicted bifunctional aldolase and dehydrogenase)